MSNIIINGIPLWHLVTIFIIIIFGGIMAIPTKIDPKEVQPGLIIDPPKEKR
jgi:hypothetical protein